MPDYDGDYARGGIYRSASRHFVGPDEYIVPLKIPPAVRDVVSQIALGPKSQDDLARILGISKNAVCKRIFRARKLGFVIRLQRNGLYWMSSGERTCTKCGKKLAKLNKGDCCFNCESS